MALTTRHFLFFLYSYGYHPDLHSFPTRRSSDLRKRRAFRRYDHTSQQARRILSHDDRNAADLLARLYGDGALPDRKSTRLNSSHVEISYSVFCLKKKKPKSTSQSQCLGTWSRVA